MLWFFWTQNVPTSAKLHLRWVEEKYTPAGSTSALLGKTGSVSQDIYDLLEVRKFRDCLRAKVQSDLGHVFLSLTDPARKIVSWWKKMGFILKQELSFLTWDFIWIEGLLDGLIFTLSLLSMKCFQDSVGLGESTVCDLGQSKAPSALTSPFSLKKRAW